MYHEAMRRFLLILLIALMPVRAGSVDAMALQMASQELDSVAVVQADAGEPEDLACRSCQACQLCMGIAPAMVMPILILKFNRPSMQSQARQAFVSALLSPALKPPIS
jgi:hypothetical protein